MGFIKRSLGTFGTQLLMISLGLINNAIVSHTLGAEGQGAFVFITLIPIMMLTLGNLGIGISNVYFIGSKKFEFGSLLVHSIAFAFTWGSLLVAGGFAFEAITAFSIKIDWSILRVAVVAVPFSISTLYLSSLVLGLNQIKRFNLITLAPKLGLFCWLSAFLFIANAGIEAVAWAFLLAETIAGIGIILYIILKINPQKLRFEIRFSIIRKLLSFGLKGFWGNVLAFLNYRLDMFLIIHFLNTEALGYYSISVLLAEKIWLIPNSIGTVLFPKISAGDREKEFTPAVCRCNLLLTSGLALILFFVSKYIILLIFPNEYIAAVAPLRWLLPGIVLLSIPKILTADLAGRGKPIYSTIAMVITVVINVSLNIFLIPQMNIEGAAIASTASYSVSAVIISWFYKRETGVKIRELLLIKKSDLVIYREFLTQIKGRIRRK